MQQGTQCYTTPGALVGGSSEVMPSIPEELLSSLESLACFAEDLDIKASGRLEALIIPEPQGSAKMEPASNPPERSYPALFEAMRCKIRRLNRTLAHLDHTIESVEL